MSIKQIKSRMVKGLEKLHKQITQFKNWKFSAEEAKERKYWDEYMHT